MTTLVGKKALIFSWFLPVTEEEILAVYETTVLANITKVWKAMLF